MIGFLFEILNDDKTNFKIFESKIRNGIKISEGKLHKVDIKKDDLNTSK